MAIRNRHQGAADARIRPPHRKRARQSQHAARREVYPLNPAEISQAKQTEWKAHDMKFGDANLIAFSSGFGDGAYATYAGLDAQDQVAVVVTDFAVIDREAIKS
jgi:hypothetical protein